MGHAAYGRGSAAIRRQIDAEAKVATRDESKPLNWADDRARLVNRIAQLENDLAKSKRALASSRAMLSVERDNRAAEMELLDSRVKEWISAALRYKRSWEKASRLIRECLTPEQVAEYRRGRDEHA